MKDDLIELPTTEEVRKDEPAWMLIELNSLGPDNKGLFRYQHIIVNRGDKLHRWTWNLGDVISAQQIRIVSWWEHTVAELQEMAEIERLDSAEYWNKFLAEKTAESTLIPDYLNNIEEQWKLINNQSVIGPGYRNQRIGFPKRAAIESRRKRSS